MMPPPHRHFGTQAAAALVIVSMLVAALPLQLFLAPALAGTAGGGSGESSRGILPSDESFDSTAFRSFDSDNNSKRDAIEARYTVSTTAISEGVSVLIKVIDGDGRTIKVHYDNFTAFRFGNQQRNWTFYAYYTGYYQVRLTLYDSQARQEDTAASGLYYLETGTVKRWITIATTGLDLDKDSYKDDVEVHVTNWTDDDVPSARVWINGSYVGNTNATGRVRSANYPVGWINIDVFWKDLHNSTSWYSEGDGTVTSGLRVRAEPFDFDGDSLEDDVVITVTNQLGLPVRNAQITVNGTSRGTTDTQGTLTLMNFARGFWVVNATKLNNFGSARFFSEGMGPGTEVDEYFFDIELTVLDLDGDDRMNDIRMRFDVDVDPPVYSNVTVWANFTWWSNGTSAFNVSTDFETHGTDTDWHPLFVRNVTYGQYFVVYELLDEDENSEDFAFDIVRLIRPSNHVNVETGVFADDGGLQMDDALFRTLRMDQAEPNITIALFNGTGVQVRSAKTDANGRRWFRNLADGIFNWTAKDPGGRLIERGRIVIGARVQVETDLADMDFDGFFDDFSVRAYNNVNRAVNTVSVTVWASNGTRVNSNLTIGGERQVLNLTKGTYFFNATYLGAELVNGTFYSYGNVDEPFKIKVLVAARDADGDGRYDDLNVSVVDVDDSPMEFAKVYVDGVYKTTTGLDGYANVANLGWGIHVVETHYSGEVAKTTFFSEGSSSSAVWTMLVLNDNEDYLDDLETVGSTNDTVLLYYAEFSNARPRQSRMWLVMDGHSQVIDVSRLGNKMAQGGTYRLTGDGVLDALLEFTYGKFSADRTATYFLEDADKENEPFFFEREMDRTMKGLGDKVDLLVYEFWWQTAMFFYELRGAVAYTVSAQPTSRFPLKAMAQRIVDTPSTDARALGTLAIDGATGGAKTMGLMVDMSKLAAFASALDDLASGLAASYPGEGWTIQDARNATTFPYIEGEAVLAASWGSQLASTLSHTSLRTKASTLKDAVDSLTVKAASTTTGFALVFPNTTDLWEDEDFQDLLNDSALMDDTAWDEFLDAFWLFRAYGIEAHATIFDAESSGRKNDVTIYVNDTYGRTIVGARVFIDRQFAGTTDSSGEVEGRNYTRGIHLVNVTWGAYEAETTFNSEGTIVPNKAPLVVITDPDEDEEVNGTYTVRGTSSDPDGSVIRVEVRFNGSAWRTAVGRANWIYEWNTRNVADGDWLIEARAYDGDLYSPIDMVNVTVLNPVVYEDILLVDDDGGQAYEVWYTQALVAGGRTFDTVTVARDQDGPDATRLGRAKIVIWLTGEESTGTLTSADRAALATFLDGGGALFLTGQDVGRDLTSDGTVTSAFLRDYMRADFVRDNADDYSLIGVPDEFISRGINISIEGGTGAPNQNYPSEIQPRSGSQAVFLYNNTAEAAVKYGGATFRTVYFAFGFEGIAERTDRNRIMDAVLDWLASNATTDPNLPPLVDAGNDVVTTVGEVTSFRGTASDPDGLVALFEWDLDGDGTYDTANTSSGRAQWTYDAVGNYTAKLRVTDNVGEAATDTVAVEVRPRPPNEPPVALAGSDVEVDQGDPVEFLMGGNDPDGYIVLYEWDYDGDGTYDEASTVAIATTYIFYDFGVYESVLRVVDDEGAEGTDTRTVTVNEIVSNQPPKADAGPDLEVQVGSPLTLVGTGNDTDGFIATYKWDFEGDGVYDFTSSTTGTVTHTYDVVATYQARLLVIDDDNAAATDTCTVTVKPVSVNIKPTADAGGDETLQVVQGEEVEFDGDGTDPDGFIVLYEWDFDGDGTWDWNDTQDRMAYWTYEQTGLFIARFRVTDNDGATDADTLRVQVSSATVQNKPPTANAGGPYEGVTGQSVTLVGTGSDEDGSVVSYEWDFEGDGTIDHFSPASGTVTITYVLSGTYQAMLYVTDDDGAMATSTATVRIERSNTAPTVRVTEPVPGQTLKGYFVVRGTATDDTGLDRVEVKVDDGGWVKAVGTLSWTYDLDVSGMVAGTHSIRVRAVDVDGAASSTVEVQFLVEEVEVPGGEDDGGLFESIFLWVIILMVVIVLVVSIAYLVRYRKP